MLLNSVILILQETLEAALLISVLLALNFQFRKSWTWLPYALIFGLVGASLYAFYISPISEWFDYVGQEVTNASIHIAIVFAMVCYTAIVSTNIAGRAYSLAAALIVSLAILREGSEILVYLSGFVYQTEEFPAVGVGASIGFGIGLSTGIIAYYTLVKLPGKWSILLPLALLAIFAGSMASQATLELSQADWLPYTAMLWDSSSLISESSIMGQLLYALFGYEATPSAAQVAAYLGTILLLVISACIPRYYRRVTQQC